MRLTCCTAKTFRGERREGNKDYHFLSICAEPHKIKNAAAFFVRCGMKGDMQKN
jgi:hypothetical protein